MRFRRTADTAAAAPATPRRTRGRPLLLRLCCLAALLAAVAAFLLLPPRARNAPPPAPVGERILVAAFATGHVTDFLRSWALRVSAVGVAAKDVRLAALDDAAAAACASAGLACARDAAVTADGFARAATGGVSLGQDMTQAVLSLNASVPPVGGAEAFRRVGRAKVAFLLRLLETEAADVAGVLLLDVDVALLKDPRPFLRSHDAVRASDVAFASECVSVRADAQQQGCLAGGFNTGVVYAKRSEKALALLRAWRDGFATPAEPHEHDQGLLNRLVRPARGRDPPRAGPWLFQAPSFGGQPAGALLASLPVAQFAGGHTYWAQRPSFRHPPLAVHATFTFSHALGKRQRLREARLWEADPPSYYEHGLFITYDADVMQRDVFGGDVASKRGIQAHFLTAAWHRAALHSALGLARALNRTLVMPRLRCACDRWWGNVLPTCAVPGADVALPFDCPMDHLFFLPNWHAAGIDFREQGFLEDPRVPMAVRNDIARVDVTPDGALPAGSRADGALRLFSSDAEAKQALKPLARRRVLLLASPVDAFCGFEAPAADVAFRTAAAKALTADVWFCGAAAHRSEPGAKRRNCTVGFAAPVPLPRGECEAAARTPRDWRDAFPGDKLLGANRLI